MNIAIIGTGSVGRTLGSRWARNGHTIIFGSRNPDSKKVKRLLAEAGENATCLGPKEAAAGAGVIVLAVPWSATVETVKSLGELKDSILVDCTNPIAAGHPVTVPPTTSGGELVANWAPGARVVKAFNTTSWENMANPVYQGEPTIMPICGDDNAAKSVVSRLAQELGFEVIDLGELDASRLLEPFALMWLRMTRVQGLGRNIAFRLVRR